MSDNGIDRIDQQIALLNSARAALAEVHTLEQAKEVRAKAKALRAYFAATKTKHDSAKESQYYAAEVMARADRKMGELLKEMKERHERQTQGEYKKLHDATFYKPTLADIGIEKTHAARAIQLAEMPEDAFELHIDAAREKNVELTVGGLLQHARNHAKEQKREQTRAELAALGETLTDALPDTVTLRVGDFRDCLDELADESVDLIFTDPPYDWDTVPLYTELANRAARVLKPGGHLLAYAGHYALAEILPAMNAHLRYWWIIALKHQGGAARLAGKYVFVEWKPILWFVKETRGDSEFVADLFESKSPDKSKHVWAQDQSEAAYYIDKLTPIGGLVADPFMGSGTTLAAATVNMRRAWGCDIDPQNIEIAKGVIHNAILDATRLS